MSEPPGVREGQRHSLHMFFYQHDPECRLCRFSSHLRGDDPGSTDDVPLGYDRPQGLDKTENVIRRMRREGTW